MSKASHSWHESAPPWSPARRIDRTAEVFWIVRDHPRTVLPSIRMNAGNPWPTAKIPADFLEHRAFVGGGDRFTGAGCHRREGGFRGSPVAAGRWSDAFPVGHRALKVGKIFLRRRFVASSFILDEDVDEDAVSAPGTTPARRRRDDRRRGAAALRSSRGPPMPIDAFSGPRMMTSQQAEPSRHCPQSNSRTPRPTTGHQPRTAWRIAQRNGPVEAGHCRGGRYRRAARRPPSA